jgi:thioredoxin reductase (NADPH)
VDCLLKRTKACATTDVEVDELFYGVGLTPNTNLFKDILDMNKSLYNNKTSHRVFNIMTSLDGVFVAGDSHDNQYRRLWWPRVKDGT